MKNQTDLYTQIRNIVLKARDRAYQSVNVIMVEAYWNVGRLIVEKEQGGKRRAIYGETILTDLSSRLTEEFGRGFDERNLRNMRAFYQAFPIWNALRSKSAKFQKRMRFEDDDFYVDLVFYNYILKCFVLVDLKIGKLTHQDIGQMDGYVRMFEENCRSEQDNPTIGLILCSNKNEAIAKYSVLQDSKQLFASKYMLYLPTEKELQREIERERRLIEGAGKKS